ncbi:MAG: thiolase family protein [Chloroflexi bacterium]|nr:thiolase family protein [Chloroflexota bacterium]
MSKRVAIVGIGQTKHEGSKPRQIYDEVVFEATKRALEDVGLDRGDIDTVVVSGWDVNDGRTISDMYVAPASGGYFKDSSKTAEEGIFALAYAYLRIASGLFDTALVTGHGHAESPFELISNKVFDPFFVRPLGISSITTLALQANAYVNKYGITEEQAARVVVKNRGNGVNNPYAHLRREVSQRGALNSKVVSLPLRALDCPPQSVGAVALVLASEDVIKKIAVSKNIAWVTGIGWATHTYHMDAADLTHVSALEKAAEVAYKMAGVRDPIKEIDVAEVHDITSYHELMAYEALGIAKPGQGGKVIDSGATDIGGELPVNPSGGVLCTNLHSGSGLLRAAEAALQVMGRAEKRQVPGVKRALAHGISAPAGAIAASHAVIVLEKE